MMISFGAYDDDVYEFLQSNKNASALVRMLVREYMRGGNIPAPTPTPIVKSKVAEEVVVSVEPEVTKEAPKVEKPMFDYSKCNTEEVMTTNNENRNKIKELEL